MFLFSYLELHLHNPVCCQINLPISGFQKFLVLLLWRCTETRTTLSPSILCGLKHSADSSHSLATGGYRQNKKQCTVRVCLSLSLSVMPLPHTAAVLDGGCKAAWAARKETRVSSFTIDEMDLASPRVAVLWRTPGAGWQLATVSDLTDQGMSGREGLVRGTTS